jgi:hypothetical protein
MSSYSTKKTTPPPNPVSHRHFVDNPGRLVASASDYFNSIGLAESGSLDPNIADSDGLVSYISGTTNPPTEMQELYDQIKPIMEGLTNVVVSAVLKSAGTDIAKQHDPQTWRDPMRQMAKAFCSGFSESQQHYDQSVKGISIATKFINILLEAVVSEGAALANFAKFLTSQGDTIQAQISTGQQSYLYASVSICHEIFQTPDGRFIYVPKFKSYFTQFSQETLKISTACASFDSFRFLFDLNVMTGAFMVETWQSNPDFQKQVTDFINRFQKANIADSTNYFDGIFNSQQA